MQPFGASMGCRHSESERGPATALLPGLSDHFFGFFAFGFFGLAAGLRLFAITHTPLLALSSYRQVK
jgi:hypothetical protein